MPKPKDDVKPAEIRELEEFYGIEIPEVDLLQNRISIGTKDDVLGYQLDDDDRIVGLTLADLTIKDIRPIGRIESLTYLNLNSNQINDIGALSTLTNLKQLILGYNPIVDMCPLERLRSLQLLDCSRTNVSDLGVISKLENLRVLYADINRIKDYTALKSLKDLESLWLMYNQIDDLAPLDGIKNVRRVMLSHNAIRVVPKEIAKEFSWLSQPYSRDRTVVLDGNPLEFPPYSVIELGPESTRNYYELAELFGDAPLSEGRIIFVGDGGSGKSSLIEKLVYGTFESGKEQTNGINIEKFHLPHPGDRRDLTFHCWDFGGQEIQHAVHKFFFTEGCLYVLVLDSRKEEEPEYWLQQIESLGGKSSVMVVFNKQDEHPVETTDRKYLKEKYPNIVGFYNISCKTGSGIADFKAQLEERVVVLRTVNERFPNNWLAIKKEIAEYTSGTQHYLSYEAYQEICRANDTGQEESQKLLLRYFNTIGAVTWFGEDTHLKFLHVLNPAWITQGVYKILTSQKTANLFGQIRVDDFHELLQPLSNDDFTYDEKHYGYLLSMMKKFDLCYTEDDRHLLIPSAFGKVPKVEYRTFKGDDVRTYILQFKDYMPLALIHRFTAQKIGEALDQNYWYTGIVLKDSKSNSVAMVHADKEAKRIYVRIKGGDQLGMWSQIRRDLAGIASSYAKIPYDELVVISDKQDEEQVVNYDDLLGYLRAQKPVYFHPRLRREFNVGFLMGLFESAEGTLKKAETGEIFKEPEHRLALPDEKSVSLFFQILNNNSPVVNTQIDTRIQVDINLQIVHQLSSALKGEASYLLSELDDTADLELRKALGKIMEFAEDVKAAKNSGDVHEKGWGRKLKSVLSTLADSAEQLKKIAEGGETLHNLFSKAKDLANHFHLDSITAWLN